ncbi:MAG: potassium channel family protein [Bacteroidota bacterium]
MARQYHSYSTEILDETFVSGELSYKQTAHVRFFNRNHKLIFSEKYGVADPEAIYSKLSSEGIIHLDNCYVKNFSLAEFRAKSGQGKMQMIPIKQFSAINAFFENEDNTDFSYAEFDGISADFVNSHFASGGVVFYKSIFKDIDVDFSNVNFGNESVNFQFTEFGKGSISFESAIFGEGDVSFVNTHFGEGKVNFKAVDFGGNVDFHFARFGKGDISFDKTRFGGQKVDFRRVEFGEGKMEFTRTNFGNGEINFEETEGGKGRKSFKKAIFGEANVSFELSVFEEELNFENAEFGRGKLSFFNSGLKGISFKSCQLNNYLDLRVNKCEKIDLSNTVIKDIIDLKPGFSKVEINELNLAGARNLGKIFIDWEDNHCYRMITAQADTSNIEKAEQFRMLKEDFNSSGQYNDEDAAYVEFKRFELKHYRELNKKKWWAAPSYFAQKLIFDRMGLYATSPVRVLGSMMLVYLFFSVMYMVLPFITGSEIQTGLAEPEPLSSVALSLYYSAITFFTIGYGDYFPYGFIRWVACVEGFCGVFMMSYFVVAFVRKMLR